jgi:hypothetical protein
MRTPEVAARNPPFLFANWAVSLNLPFLARFELQSRLFNGSARIWGSASNLSLAQKSWFRKLAWLIGCQLPPTKTPSLTPFLTGSKNLVTTSVFSSYH